MKKVGTAVILCGGKSSRMGFDKSLIEIKGKLLIEIVCEKLEKIFDEIILVTENREKFKHLKYKVVEDIERNYGPAGGIYTGLKYSESKYAFFLACDMPKINVNFIRYIMEVIKDGNYDGLMCKHNNWIEPLYAFYSKDLIKNFQNGIKENNLVLYDIIKNSNIKYITEETVRKYSENLDMFTNLNYIKDLEILKDI
ncbi:molybdenum cofactor guanylyltransferase [Clostridiaceae bacterium UIB06]|uniref:Probable molybdenum cofactor guanylyltransferase n=1 Tax=Clostridium thailandense TaxID=2794346 RepID=A0A949TM29_9CLOT|nr:molybdenum cofactor guanylyltransferase [Clostridium thailandense]MBV7274860.1 molybdenum cofactor guanylyltransferase [Clostridium thailandense]MCH5137605.1 molybdenum cofactor guanylyltransferase [Clostridiaceae bacterium UIB06]